MIVSTDAPSRSRSDTPSSRTASGLMTRTTPAESNATTPSAIDSTTAAIWRRLSWIAPNASPSVAAMRVVRRGEVLDLVGHEAGGEPLLEVAGRDRRCRLRHRPDAPADELGEPEAEQAGDRERDPEGDPQPVADGLQDRDGQVDGARGDDDTLALAVRAAQRLRRHDPAVRPQVARRVRRALVRARRAARTRARRRSGRCRRPTRAGRPRCRRPRCRRRRCRGTRRRARARGRCR